MAEIAMPFEPNHLIAVALRWQGRRVADAAGGVVAIDFGWLGGQAGSPKAREHPQGNRCQ